MRQAAALRVWALAVAGICLPACSSGGAAQAPATSQATADAGDAAPDALVDAPADQGAEPAPDAPEEASSGPITLTVYTTSDEHGWLQPVTQNGVVYGGVANFFASAKADGFDPTRDLLVSCGDNWAGPAISTLFQGKPVVEAFNYMGYAATAIGNHEFDFGQAVLAERIGDSHYAYLSANTRDAATGDQAPFALPYKIVTIQGIDIGLVGLTTPDTATATNPPNVAGLSFGSPLETLESVVPRVRADGAELVLVVAHESFAQSLAMAHQLTVPVDAIFTGHDHGNANIVANGIPIIGSGWALRGYSTTRFEFDAADGTTTFIDTKYKPLVYAESGTNPVTPDPGLLALLDGWQQQVDAQLGEEIGYTVTGIPMSTWQQGNWVTDAWLAEYPDADFAMENFGGLRQTIPEGAITLEQVFGMMPFDNVIYELELTGAQVKQDLAVATTSCAEFSGCYPAVAGLTFSGMGNAVQVNLPGGTPIDPNATYRVLVNDYMYNAGPYPLSTQDTTPIDLGVNYRDPVASWTKQLGSSPQDPLEAHIDPAPRNE